MEKQVYFDRMGSGIQAKVLFTYGDVVINPAETAMSGNSLGNKVLIRAAVEEQQFLEMFKRNMDFNK